MRTVGARLLTAGAVALLATACGTWTMAGQGANRRAWDRDNTNITPANVSALTPSWDGAVAGAAEVIGDANRILTTGPSVRGLDPATGAQQWSRTARTAALRDSDAFIATAGSTCSLRRITASTGATTASTTFGGPAVPPNLGGMSLCAISGTMLDSDGVVVVPWYYAAVTPAPHCASSWGYNIGITAFDGALAPIWTRSVSASGCGTTPSDLLTHPSFGSATRSNAHWLTTHGDAVEALPTGCTGACAPTWTAPVTHPVGPAISVSKTSVAIADDDAIRAFDETTGTPQWTGALGAGGATSLAATNSRIFAIGGSTLLAFRAGGCSAATCSPTWTASLGTAGHQRASIAGDVVYVAVGTNVLAFSVDGCGAATCPVLTTKSVTNTVTGPPTPLGSRLLVPTTAAIRTFTLPAS